MNVAEMIRVLRLELERVDRCLMALEALAGPRRGRPRKLPLPLGRRPHNGTRSSVAAVATPKAKRGAGG